MTILHEVQRSGTRPSNYEAPASLAGALEILGAHPETARPIAGGTDLMVELDRGARPETTTLVDLSRIPGLDEIHLTDTDITLGALVTHNQVVRSDACRQDATPLAQACLEVGSPQLRNRATVVGNVVTASPANDTISALLVLGAEVQLASVAGTRSLPVAEFFVGFRDTALAPGELVTGIRVPRLRADQRGVFVKLGLRRAQAISVVHLAAVLTLGSDPSRDAGPAMVEDARLAVGSVAATVVELDEFREQLVGKVPTADVAAAAGQAVAGAISPIDDLRSTADYRADAVATMVARAVEVLAAGEQLAVWPEVIPNLWGPSFLGRFPTGEGTACSLSSDDVIVAHVNGREVSATGVEQNLLDWLRDHAGASGVKEGCAEGECGACTVDLDGAAVMSCLVPAGRANGAAITSVEGLTDASGKLHAVQEAFVQCAAVQCGFCTPGLLVAASKLLQEIPEPTRQDVTRGLAGNLCRCTGYNAIHDALQVASAKEAQ